VIAIANMDALPRIAAGATSNASAQTIASPFPFMGTVIIRESFPAG
jgi:hypothetical protein